MKQIDLEDWLMSSVAAIPANPSRLQVQTEKDRKMTVTSGLRCYELSKLQGQDSLLEKMLLVTSPWASMMCYLIWRSKTTPQGRLLFQLVPKMRNTGEIESSLLHTLTATGNQMSPSMRARDPGSWWRTPQASNATQGPKSKHHYEKCKVTGENAITLVDQVRHTPQMLPTPTARDYKGASGRAYKGEAKDLPSEVGGSLNPEFCEWLMGFPIGWTELEV